MAQALDAKAKAFDNIVKIGRTHLQDATPIRLGQEFSGYAAQMKLGIARAERALTALCELPIGGTAVGTGINTHKEFGSRVSKLLADKTGVPFKEADNHFENQHDLVGLPRANCGESLCGIDLFLLVARLQTGCHDRNWLGLT